MSDNTCFCFLIICNLYVFLCVYVRSNCIYLITDKVAVNMMLSFSLHTATPSVPYRYQAVSVVLRGILICTYIHKCIYYSTYVTEFNKSRHGHTHAHAYTHTHTYRVASESDIFHYSIATFVRMSIDQWFITVLVPKDFQSAFPVGCFCDLSNVIHEW